jgi:hypothetical protein
MRCGKLKGDTQALWFICALLVAVVYFPLKGLNAATVLVPAGANWKYLDDGTEVFRSNMPAGPITAGTLAASAVGRADEVAWHETGVSPGLLVHGTNVLAAEVHQVSGASSDISFDLQLIGGPPAAVCDITMSQASYAVGAIVTASTLRLANPGIQDISVELKIWLQLPGFPPLPVVNAGADGSLVLPAGLDEDFGPVSLFLVTAATPVGAYGLSCRMLDPVTNELLAEDLNPFSVVSP